MAHYHKDKFKTIAEDTQAIFESDEIDMTECIEGTKLYQPNSVFSEDGNVYENDEISISVTESTTTNAAYELYEEVGEVCVLNFASANKPGGGWLNGASAQEESLTRVSGLYYSLKKYDSLYSTGLWSDGEFYNDYTIYSSKVPFIKDDDGEIIDTKFISVITSAAVNYNKIKDLTPDKEATIEHITRRRIKDIFKVAIVNHQRNLVLGAYGCGVFKNDPKKIATYFKEYTEKYSEYFDNIVFAIYDSTPTKEVVNTFKDII